MPLAEPRFCTHRVFPEDVFLFVLGGYSAEHPVIKVFWRVVEGFTDEEKRKLLKFVTSCSRPPLLGFKVHGLGAQRCSGRGSRAKWASVRAACSEDSVCCSGRSAQAVIFTVSVTSLTQCFDLFTEGLAVGFIWGFSCVHSPDPSLVIAVTRLKREQVQPGGLTLTSVTSPGVCAAQTGLPPQLERAWAHVLVSVARSDTRAGVDLLLVLLCSFTLLGLRVSFLIVHVDLISWLNIFIS